MSYKQKPECPSGKTRTEDFAQNYVFIGQWGSKQYRPGSGFFLGSDTGGRRCCRSKQAEEKINDNESYMRFLAIKHVHISTRYINSHQNDYCQSICENSPNAKIFYPETYNFFPDNWRTFHLSYQPGGCV